MLEGVKSFGKKKINKGRNKDQDKELGVREGLSSSE